MYWKLRQINDLISEIVLGCHCHNNCNEMYSLLCIRCVKSTQFI